MRENFSRSRRSYCGGSHPTETFFYKQRKEKIYNKPPFNPRNSNNKRNEFNGRKPNTCFRCVSQDHFIANIPKPDTSDKKVHWNMENPKTCAYRLKKIQKMLEISTDKSESQKIRVYVMYVYQFRNPQKILWRQLATDQLNFRLRCDLSHDTRDFGFYSRLIGGNR